MPLKLLHEADIPGSIPKVVGLVIILSLFGKYVNEL